MQTLPSDPQPAPGARGLTLAPFRGVRYASDRVSGIANVTSPPYDVIGPGTVERLLEAEPHNVVRLILPGAGSPRSLPGPEADQMAARDLHGWLASGVLLRDPRPALYIYEQSLPAGGGAAGTGAWEVVQRGLVGALRLVPPGSPSVLPHEDVMPGPVQGRRELMETTQANLEPIFLLYDSGDGAGGPSGATRLVDEVAEAREPLLSAVTDDGMRHRVWAVTDPAAHGLVAADLARRSALIADGHHRYAAYLDMQDRGRVAGQHDGPLDYGLAFLVDAGAYPPRIGAIHRVIPGLPPARAAEMAKEAVSVHAVPGDLDEAVRVLADAGRRGAAFLLTDGRTDGSAHYLLTEPLPGRRPRSCRRSIRHAGAVWRRRCSASCLFRVPGNCVTPSRRWSWCPGTRPRRPRRPGRRAAPRSSVTRCRPRTSAPSPRTGNGCHASRRRSARSRAPGS